ncbi:ribonuclease H [Ferviditalea candida]|uniref:Ribonuclease H n=1 Tax=Ferviditalea candida TaxID=3108399 RepID=A0ABU5ZII0_9BACL|nr:ribonuclease H family protein [Paenibacillaceae bacterium T2]
MASKNKQYVVWVGRTPGIYSAWDQCRAQIEGFPGAKYKSYESRAEAEKAFARGSQDAFKASGKPSASAKRTPGDLSYAETAEEVDENSISVDAGCSGNPGIVEYKGVDTKTGDILFHHGPISKGTNNLGEFLAIVHGLAYLQQRGSGKTIYSDSKTAIKWVKDKKVATSLPRDESTEEIWSLVDRALKWLHSNAYTNPIKKWKTEQWGEIKADFGRK